MAGPPDPSMQKVFDAWVGQQENNLQILVRAQTALEQEVSSGAAQLADVYPGDRDGGSYANELQMIRTVISQQISELQLAFQGGVSSFKDFLVNTLDFFPDEVEQLVQENPVPTVTAGGAVARLMAKAAAQKSAEAAAISQGGTMSVAAPAAASSEAGTISVAAQGAEAAGAAAAEGGVTASAVPVAAAAEAVPVVATGTAAAAETTVAAGALEGGGLLAGGLTITSVLTGTIVVIALVGGGIFIYSKVNGGSNSTPAQSPPGASAAQNPGPPAAAPPATFDIDGNYNGTLDGTPCQAPECHFTVKKESDPSGPDISQAGSITFTYTAVNYKPALNGVASTVNETIGPMKASLGQNGTLQGFGSTTDADTTPGGGNTTTSDYTLSGFFFNVAKGPPSFSITMNVGGIQYQLTGTRK